MQYVEVFKIWLTFDINKQTNNKSNTIKTIFLLYFDLTLTFFIIIGI